MVSASSVYSGNYPAYKAFDGNRSNNGWCPSNASFASGIYVQYQFEKAVKINVVSAFYKITDSVATFKLLGSNNGTTWNNLASDIKTGRNDFKFYSVNNEELYTHYRFVMTSHSATPNNGDGYKFQLYG